MLSFPVRLAFMMFCLEQSVCDAAVGIYHIILVLLLPSIVFDSMSVCCSNNQCMSFLHMDRRLIKEQGVKILMFESLCVMYMCAYMYTCTDMYGFI